MGVHPATVLDSNERLMDDARHARPPRTPPREIDILDPRLYDDPWDTYRWLREAQPGPLGRRERAVGGVPPRGGEPHQPPPGALLRGRGRPTQVAAPMSIIAMDDPEHTRQRRLINKGFTPARCASSATTCGS